ncbi:serine/threonine-protein kinase Nek3-like [Haliotis rufescens]|uniref:serine/threonine-protein kinase Nek3-like n=1 Tax=Haliotis rufescens TaxID=6454 RepID=UPI001EB08462|nr:serine/threonine-protein kinase Nek3-like [Haliotis rufescens]
MAGKYEKLCLLGSGSFGQAWLVTNKDQLKSVLKEIKLTSLSEKEVDQALVEVTVLAKCRHVNVVKYRETFVEEKCLKIVMEYADGGDLQKKIQDQKGIHFSKEIVFDWFVQIAFALKYIHGKNILHRDLKPQNVFLTSQNIVKLGDFGISRILQNTMDHAVTTIGTPFYLSPEICQKRPYNHKSDLWALGCILYELCCLRVPFDAPNLTSLVLKIVEAKYQPVPTHYGPLIEDLVSVLLSPNPDKRPSAEQLLTVPNLQPYIEQLLKGHIERKRSITESPPECDPPLPKSCKDKVDPPSVPRNIEKPCRVEKKMEEVVSPLIRVGLRRDSIPKVKVRVTGRRASAPAISHFSDMRASSCHPARIFNGRVISPCIMEETSSPEAKTPEKNPPKSKRADRIPVYNKPDPKKIIFENKENIPSMYKGGRVLRRHSLFTPAINSLVKTQREIMSCQVPKRVPKAKNGPPPTMNLYRVYLNSQSECESPATAASSVSYTTDDDVFDSGHTPMSVCSSRPTSSISSLTYKIDSMTVTETPPQDSPTSAVSSSSMKQLQVLYESVIANHGSTRKAVVTLTSYLQEQLGAQSFQHLYSLVLDSAKSATDFKVLREKAGKKILYMPMVIQLLQLENALG